MTRIAAPNLNQQGQKRGSHSYLVLLLLALLVYPLSASAQTTTSTIEGFVNDAKKAVVAGAQHELVVLSADHK